MSRDPRIARMLEAERLASTPKHWVRLGTACNSDCVFCLDGDAPRDLLLGAEDVRAEIRRGRERLGARRVVLSGGEPTIHPSFPELARFAKSIGYEWVQTITNGNRLADRAFFEACAAAGLDEVTFSLHGDTPALHDALTRVPGSFERLTKALLRCLRDGRIVVSVDIVLCRENLEHVEGIVELCLGLGVREFDLLHLIPQGRAYEQRERLFYEASESVGHLQRVLRLNRHPDCHVWTNRLPPQFLEGFEDLIQDPSKLHDETTGREQVLRRYLDEGRPLPCREAERCPHCPLSPFCATLDVVVERLHRGRWDVLRVGRGWRDLDPKAALPFGCSGLGVEVEDTGELAAVPVPAGAAGVTARAHGASPLDRRALPQAPLRLVARGRAQLEAWLGAPLPAQVSVEVELDRQAAEWLLEHRERVAALGDAVVLRQPGRETLRAAVDADVPDPPALFSALPPTPVSGLAPCLAPGGRIVAGPRVLDATLFDSATGRLDVTALVEHHIRDHYFVQSLRCRACALADVCPGLHIQTVRARGLRLARPLAAGAGLEQTRAALSPQAQELHAGAVGRTPAQPAAPELPEAWRRFGRVPERPAGSAAAARG